MVRFESCDVVVAYNCRLRIVARLSATLFSVHFAYACSHTVNKCVRRREGRCRFSGIGCLALALKRFDRKVRLALYEER